MCFFCFNKIILLCIFFNVTHNSVALRAFSVFLLEILTFHRGQREESGTVFLLQVWLHINWYLNFQEKLNIEAGRTCYAQLQWDFIVACKKLGHEMAETFPFLEGCGWPLPLPWLEVGQEVPDITVLQKAF